MANARAAGGVVLADAWLRRAIVCWLAGSALFSGSVYALVLGYRFNGWMGPVTPLGGLTMMGGWGALLAAALV